jgi:hypothetical protein
MAGELKLLHTLTESTSQVYYHVASHKLVPKIQKEGIKPQKKPSWTGAFGQDIRDCKNCIYAFTTMKAAVRWAFKAQWDTREQNEKYSIISFNTKPKDWDLDTHIEAQFMDRGTWVKSKKSVAPNDIIKVEPLTRDMSKLLRD